jgi:hypothetical protein
MPTTNLAGSRKCERKSKTMPVSLVLREGSQLSDSQACVLDISLSGARVRTKLPLFPGEQVGVVPPGDTALPLPARTVWVQEDQNLWTLAGLEFLDEPEIH